MLAPSLSSVLASERSFPALLNVVFFQRLAAEPPAHLGRARLRDVGENRHVCRVPILRRLLIENVPESAYIADLTVNVDRQIGLRALQKHTQLTELQDRSRENWLR